MRKQIRLIVAITLLLQVKNSLAQDPGLTSGDQSVFPQYAPTVLPPSPDAYSFTKYGNLPIGLNTGTAQYSLPIYTIQSGSLSHSIGVNYSSNGVKVDEIATRVGINWSLRAGGMITRTVMDLPDDATAVYPIFFHGYAASGEHAWTFYDYVFHAADAVRPDYQPDEYSFNVDGYTGKFLKRENGDYTLLNSSGMKIERNTNGFILIAPTGVKYFFYLTESARNYSLPENTSFEWQPSQVNTAWYLTKILSPNRDSIIFNYSTVHSNPDSAISYYNGVIQNFSSGTSYRLALNPGDYTMGYLGTSLPSLPALNFECTSTPGLVTIVQKTDNNPKYLSSINFKGGSVNFIYSDRDDMPLEKKLDSVKVIRASDSKLIKCVALQYTYSNASTTYDNTQILPGWNFPTTYPSLRKRLFLTGFDELATDFSTKQHHGFEYDDIDGLPPRLSFAQDRYGSFNGKLNTYFFPNDTWFDLHLHGLQFGGDRTYNFNKAKKGILKKITYPTGGYTEFEYEPNKTEYLYSWVNRRDSVYVVFDTSKSVGQQIISDTLHFERDYGILTLFTRCDWASTPVNTGPPGGPDSILEGTYHIKLYIEDINTNECTLCGSEIKPVTSQAVSFLLPTGTYRIRAVANRPRLRARFSLTQTRKEIDNSDTSGIAGIRVKTITDYATPGYRSNRREFIYGNWEDSTSSSGTGIYVSNSDDISWTRALGGSFAPYQDVSVCGYNTIHSNSVKSTYLTENNTVFYTKVIELNTGDGTKNNGGTEYQFYTDLKLAPIPINFTWGQYVWDAMAYVPPGAAQTNSDFRTGQLYNTKVFTYQQKYGARSILQETNNYLSIDSSSLIIDTFTVSHQVVKRDLYPPNWPVFYDFDIYRYWRYYYFLKQDSTVQKTYTSTGQLVNKIAYTSYNPDNYKPSEIQYTSSANDTKKVNRRYVTDVGPLEDEFETSAIMVGRNMIDALLDETNSTGSVEMSKKHMQYNLINGLMLPYNAYSSLKGGSEYLEASYQQYDSCGNIQQFTAKDGVVTSIIWGYDKQYPVAKIVGKTYNDAISESSINMAVVNNPSSDNALQTELNKLRSLSGSLATTYIYDPLIGVKTETDANGRSIYYQYDKFNRLSIVRDRNNNIIKKICYNFQGQPVDCGQGTVAAWTAISSACEEDTAGLNTGNLIVTEKDMNPASATYNQTRNVTMFNAGLCLKCDAECTGVNKKCINSVCVTGVKIWIAVEYLGDGQYNTTYVYYWPDYCLFSEEFEEILPYDPLVLEPFCPL